MDLPEGGGAAVRGARVPVQGSLRAVRTDLHESLVQLANEVAAIHDMTRAWAPEVAAFLYADEHT